MRESGHRWAVYLGLISENPSPQRKPVVFWLMAAGSLALAVFWFFSARDEVPWVWPLCVLTGLANLVLGVRATRRESRGRP